MTHSAEATSCTTTERPIEGFGGSSMHEADEGYQIVTAQLSSDQETEPARVPVPLYEKRQFFRDPSFEEMQTTGRQCQLPLRPTIISYV